MKKFMAVLLTCLMILMMIVSCSDNTEKSDDSSETTTTSESIAETEEVNYLDSLPSTDFDEYEFRFHVRNCCLHNAGVYQESETGDVVNDAVYYRNRNIEEKFNITIVESILDQDGEPILMRNAILADDHIADVTIPHFRFLGNMALEDMLIDMATMPHIDFTQDWWATDLIDNYSIFDKYYVAQGSIDVDNITYNGAIYFNKRLASEYVADDLYATVNDGKWTLDKMNQVVRSVGQDLNGDSTISIDNDLFGLACAHGFFFMYQSGADQPTTVRDENNIPQLAINTPKMVSIAEKVYEFTHAYEYSHIVAHIEPSIFTNGNILLLVDLLNAATSNAFRDMDDDFGILPFPKYDEQQSQYYSHASAHSSLIGVPITTRDTERAGLIIEALTVEGWNLIKPALYDIALKVKNVRDEDSAQMIDIILQGRTGDFADIYDEWGLVYTLDNLVGRQGSTDFSSFYAANEKVTQKRLETAIKVFQGDE